ncbi:MAG: hypothetical protein QGG14_08490 [Planctomycetota bacterium]|nr:hypothetical protein [Planctomycetota bacterium]
MDHEALTMLRRLAPLLLATSLTAQTKPTVCGALIPGTPLAGTNSAAPRIVDLGSAKTIQIEIFGHSENRGYHTFLQPMLDAAPPLAGVKFIVTNNWIGGQEAFRWADPTQRGYRTIDARLRSRAHPMLSLCLFSNNATYPIRKADTTDANFVRFLSNLQSIADHLHANGTGAAMVYFSAHRYKPSNSLSAWLENPAVGHILVEAGKQKKGWIKPGPEQHGLHWCCFPSCYANDRAHTNSTGDKLMAEAWYNLLVRELTGCYSEEYGRGATGSGGHWPVLKPVAGFPKVGNANFRLRTSATLGGAPLVYLLGLDKLPGPILVNPLVLLYGAASGSGPGNGTHQLPLPIPNDVGLHGALLQVQTAALDSGATLGLSFTNGLTLGLCK